VPSWQNNEPQTCIPKGLHFNEIADGYRDYRGSGGDVVAGVGRFQQSVTIVEQRLKPRNIP
jgi:hypothetical protein